MSKTQISPVENDHVAIRLLEETDLPLTLSWRNQDSVRQWFINSNVIKYEQHREWFTRYQKLDNDFIFIILSKELNFQPVGQISLYAINWDEKTGEYGRLIIGEPKARGKGLGKSASLLLLDIGFNILMLDEIKLEVKENNIAAIKIYQSLGFEEKDNSNGLISMSIYKKSYQSSLI